MKKELIWYVCYGSNLCFKRFMCYLTGEGLPEYGIEADINRKCKDQTPPKENKVVNIPYELYFGYKSRSWEYKGVCFIDFNIKSNSIGRAYLITKEQYEHVKSHEESLYSFDVKLGQIDGYDAITFTSRVRQIFNKPSEKYKEVLIKGLMECGLSKEAATKYLDERIKI